MQQGVCGKGKKAPKENRAGVFTGGEVNLGQQQKKNRGGTVNLGGHLGKNRGGEHSLGGMRGLEV